MIPCSRRRDSPSAAWRTAHGITPQPSLEASTASSTVATSVMRLSRSAVAAASMSAWMTSSRSEASPAAEPHRRGLLRADVPPDHA